MSNSAALGQPIYNFLGKKGGEFLGQALGKPELGQRIGAFVSEALGKHEVNTAKREEAMYRGNRKGAKGKKRSRS